MSAWTWIRSWVSAPYDEDVDQRAKQERKDLEALDNLPQADLRVGAGAGAGVGVGARADVGVGAGVVLVPDPVPAIVVIPVDNRPATPFYESCAVHLFGDAAERAKGPYGRLLKYLLAHYIATGVKSDYFKTAHLDGFDVESQYNVAMLMLSSDLSVGVWTYRLLARMLGVKEVTVNQTVYTRVDDEKKEEKELRPRIYDAVQIAKEFKSTDLGDLVKAPTGPAHAPYLTLHVGVIDIPTTISAIYDKIWTGVLGSTERRLIYAFLRYGLSNTPRALAAILDPKKVTATTTVQTIVSEETGAVNYAYIDAARYAAYASTYIPASVWNRTDGTGLRYRDAVSNYPRQLPLETVPRVLTIKSVK